MRRRRQARMWRQVSDEQKKAAARVAQVCSALAEERGGEVVTAGLSKTGRATLRCTTCGKVCCRDKEAAEEAVAKIPDPMLAYRSERCGWWHLSTQRGREPQQEE